VACELRLELADPMLGSLPRLLQALLKGGIEDLRIRRPEGLELDGGLGVLCGRSLLGSSLRQLGVVGVEAGIAGPGAAAGDLPAHAGPEGNHAAGDRAHILFGKKAQTLEIRS
jgi:hypothetical protein